MIKRHIQRAYGFARPHAPQFLRYLLSGGGAALFELIGFQLLLFLMPYQIAGPVSSGIGITSAFLLHKYFAFQKRENTGRQSWRYALLVAWNFIAQNLLLILFVEVLGLHPTLAKILSIGCSVSWNFLLYKLFVYA